MPLHSPPPPDSPEHGDDDAFARDDDGLNPEDVAAGHQNLGTGHQDVTTGLRGDGARYDDVPAGPRPGDELTLIVADADAGSRLDVFLVRHVPGQSRSFLARAIERSAVRVDGVVARASQKLRAGGRVCMTVPEPPRSGPAAEEIPLVFLHVDAAIAVVDKPAGMVVHPAKGNWKGTLAGALKWHLERPGADGPGLSTFGGPTRPGIVHRLDRDTSGVIVVARSEQAHQALAKQFERRTVTKTYLAITQGQPQFDRDEIDLPIGIHPYQREKMAVRRDHPTSREAVTRFEVLERFGAAALVRVAPKTGRTHQIRVHLAAIGCAVLCDGLYSGRSVIRASFFGRGGAADEPLIARQALHAASLAIDHPVSGGRMEFAAALPADMQRVLDSLRSAGPAAHPAGG